MTTISLLVTGKTELHALGECLAQVFPADFRYVNNPVANPEMHLRGFTSRDCQQLVGVELKPDSDLAWFTQHLVAEAYPGRRGTPPDLVIGIDDVELFNAGHTDVVVRVLRDAVRAHVEATWNASARERVYARLRVLAKPERCPFVRALLVDIARTVPPRPEYAPLLTTEPRCATWPPSRNRLLRNI